ncbi:EF-hand domain-containing protein d1 [Plakobranchus ocellatus]|uniref:EF-hand domain-containing protein d1 n=1 Tax=Plakobranchus ocellatus TaxID=259542 RepID=A0AAV4BZ52_9GAST|nr:EF-hand domain-containing protein d1 [Plakobranchus ocellatus]
MVGTTLYKTLFLLGVCAGVMKGAIGDDRNDVCSNINPNVDAGSEFTFKNKFQVHVESVLPDLGTIINAPMAFSEKNKMFKATLTAPGYNRALYNDYEYSQTLAYDFLSGGRGSCRVDPTMNERWNLFLIPQPPAEGTEMKTSDALRLTGPSGFGGEQIALERKSVGSKFRSMTVTEYVSCQKIKAANGAEIIAKVTHLFSDAGFAKSETGSVPVQVKIIGRYTSGNDKGKDVTQTYNFFHYQTSFGDEVFEAPTGIVCPNRVGPNNFPEQPTHVQFGQEIHYPNDAPKMRTIKTTYDMEFNFVLEQTFNEDPSKRDEFRLDDFYSGLTYTFNPDTGECSLSNITDNIKMNDYVEENGKIRMANPGEFFSTDNIEYHYNGKKHFRGLQTEAWIGKEEKTGRTFEWYFAWPSQRPTVDAHKAQVLLERMLSEFPDSDNESEVTTEVVDELCRLQNEASTSTATELCNTNSETEAIIEPTVTIDVINQLYHTKMTFQAVKPSHVIHTLNLITIAILTMF